MKKLLSITLSLVFALTVLTGSLAFGAAKAPAKKTTSAYKDGTYKAEYNTFDNAHGGYKDTVALTINGGKITSCVYDAVTKDGKKKSKDAAYEKNMKAVNGLGPVEYLSQLSKKLVSTQNVDKVDTISGATGSTMTFKALVNAALNNAKKGVKTTAVVAR